MIIGERNYKLALTGETLIIYKENFHKDFLTVVSNPNNLVEDYETLFSVIWALAKSSNNNIEDYVEFMKKLNPQALHDIIKIETIISVMNVINGDSEVTVESKKDEKDDTKKNP